MQGGIHWDIQDFLLDHFEREKEQEIEVIIRTKTKG